jgi:hypothetical protein
VDADRLIRLRRALTSICALSVLWATLVAITGGFVLHLAGTPVTSRNPRNPLLIAIMAAIAAWALPGRRRAAREAVERWTPRARWLHANWPRSVDLAAIIAAVGCGVLLTIWARGQTLWLDEQMIALNVRERSFTGLAGPLWFGQSAPLGWLILQRAVLLGLGTGELALRLVPMLFGGATVAVAVWVGRRWMNAIGAAVFVLLCTFGRWTSHYPFEVKHYSADVFWGLLIPALAAWTLESRAPRKQLAGRGGILRGLRHGLPGRVAIWWTAASVGLWVANGALLATPPCAVVLLVLLWRRAGARAALMFALVGVVWLASFGAHFWFSIRHTLASEYLRNYWSGGLPPDSLGLAGLVGWLGARFEPLALNPGGSERWLMFWLAALCGFGLAWRRLGMFLTVMVASAFALGALALVPLHDRLSLWIVPALYLGIAFFVDAAARVARDGWVRRRWLPMMPALAALAVVVSLGKDIVDRGVHELRFGREAGSNHGLDDRAAIGWLMRQRQPGDALMTTHFGLPAVWWYGGIAVGDANAGERLRDGSPILRAAHADSAPDCAPDALRHALGHRDRVLVYSGFPETPDGFDDLLIGRLSDLGVVTAHREFALISRAAVIDLRPGSTVRGSAAPRAEGARPPGCVLLSPARRW